MTPRTAGTADSVSRTACGGHKIPSPEADVLASISDPALDQLMATASRSQRGGLGPWKLVRNHDVFPPAWVVGRVEVVSSWGKLYTTPLAIRSIGRCLVHRPRSSASAAGTLRTGCAPRALGRPIGDRRARRIVHPDHAADLLPWLGVPIKRRPGTTRLQGRWRPSGAYRRVRHQPRHVCLPADRIEKCRNNLAGRNRCHYHRPGCGRLDLGVQKQTQVN